VGSWTQTDHTRPQTATCPGLAAERWAGTRSRVTCGNASGDRRDLRILISEHSEPCDLRRWVCRPAVINAFCVPWSEASSVPGRSGRCTAVRYLCWSCSASVVGAELAVWIPDRLSAGSWTARCVARAGELDGQTVRVGDRPRLPSASRLRADGAVAGPAAKLLAQVPALAVPGIYTRLKRITHIVTVLFGHRGHRIGRVESASGSSGLRCVSKETRVWGSGTSSRSNHVNASNADRSCKRYPKHRWMEPSPTRR
jgi:hypothetical protein